MLKNFFRTGISVEASPRDALRKLKNAQIPAYFCKKEGARFLFSVKNQDVKKVFAIFAKPCYNVSVYSKSGYNKLFSRAAARAGIIVGAIAFAVLSYLSQSLVLKIEVTGSGAYLEPEVKRIVREAGAGEWQGVSSFDCPTATGKILSLPRVTFCNIKKRGSVLCVDVRCDGESYDSVNYDPLYSDVSGTVRSIVAICGTAKKSAGDEVEKGDILIDPVTLSGEEYVKSIAAGYAEVEWSGEKVYFSPVESEKARREAYQSLRLEGEILDLSHTVEKAEGGVNYVIKYVCLKRLSQNL